MDPVLRKDIHNSDVPRLCIACEARHKGVCGVLEPAQLAELSRHTQRQSVTPGTQISAEGTESGRLANILSGVVKLSKLLPDGRQQIVGLQFAPDLLGRPFAGENLVDAEAATELRLCSFPRSVLEKILGAAPAGEHRLHQQALRELDEARDWMITLGRKTAAEKLASFLCLIAEHADPGDTGGTPAPQFDLPLKRADIADFLGLTIETVSRQVTRLRQAGIIEVENYRRVRVLDMARLRSARDGTG